MPDLPDRPAPPQPLLHRVRIWLEWVGPGRVAAASVAVLAVLAGAYWLVRPPAAATEAGLPYTAGAGSSVAGSTSSTHPEVVAATTVEIAEVVVHVAGAVAQPGVYRLPSSARVIDAVERAGGLAADAQPDAVNLAAPVVDGERVYVPHMGETVPMVTTAQATPGGATPAGPVDVNSAGVEELDQLPGVGPATAAAIVAYRDQHGPFGSVDGLAEVRGIGPAKLEALRGLVTV